MIHKWVALLDNPLLKRQHMHNTIYLSTLFLPLRLLYEGERSTNSNIGHYKTIGFACIVLIINDLRA